MVERGKENFERFLAENEARAGSVIHDLWVSKDPHLWASDPYFYARLGSLADKLGQVMFAHDILEEGLRFFPDNLRLVQLFALSSIKCGFLLQARDLLGALMERGHQDEETLGILGRVYKEMWLVADRSNVHHPFLTRSRDLYLKAFMQNRGYYSGINAASLSLLAGDRESAEKLARNVLKSCTSRVRSDPHPDYWILATIGEACALLDRREESLAYYGKARELVGSNFSDLASMRRQLNLLSTVTSVAGDVLDDLWIPPVVAFTGHMIDPPGRHPPCFPRSIADAVADRVGGALESMEAQIGYASAASGGDVIFLEKLQERGGETNVILPFDQEDFFATSVDYAGEEWHHRVKTALEKCSTVEQATRGKYEGDDVLFRYANQIIVGKTVLRSRFLETDAVLLAVWDGNRSREVGGTAELVHMWKKRGYPMTVVDLRTIGERPTEIGGSPRKRRPPRRTSRTAHVRREIKALLFADVVGYSRLTEEQIPCFVDGFLGTLAARLSKSCLRPLQKNTWGDALYFVFEECGAAAECALVLRDMMREIDWAKLGLPEDLSMRIGLHAGPVYRGREPLLRRQNFFGYHVNQAARIEPITRPGNVYASEQFAALLMGSAADHLECRYVGIIVLPKDFGSYPIYHIKRRYEIE